MWKMATHSVNTILTLTLPSDFACEFTAFKREKENHIMENEDLSGWEEAFANVTGETTTASTESAPSDNKETAEPTKTEPSNEIGQPSTEPSNAGNVEETKKEAPQSQPSQPMNRHQQNNANAQRRIRNKERDRERDATLQLQRNKIQRLQDEENRLASKETLTDYEQSRLDSIREQREDITDSYNMMVGDLQKDYEMDFDHSVAEQLDGFFDPNQALNAIYKYASYVNRNEPLLVDAMNNEKWGKHLIAEWAINLERKPSAKASWEAMTTRQKMKWIDKTLEALDNLHNPKQNSVPTNVPPKSAPPSIANVNASKSAVNVGLASTGRSQTTNNAPSTDSFGSLIEAELQKLGVKPF